MDESTCIVGGCDSLPQKSRPDGKCHKHWCTWEVPVQYQCKVIGCTHRRRRRGYCDNHAAKLRSNGVDELSADGSVMTERSCQGCGEDITGSHGCKKYCSGACRAACRKRLKKMEDPDWTPYLSAAEQKSKRAQSVVLDEDGDRECAFCGARFIWKSARLGGGGHPPRYCTLKCRSAGTKRMAAERGYRNPLAARSTCEMCGDAVFARSKASAGKRCANCRQIPALSQLPPDHWARWYGKSSKWPNKHKRKPVLDVSRVFVYGTCAWCAESFMSEWHGQGGLLPRYCSKRCKSAKRRNLRSMRKRASFVADVNRASIFERDGWRCHICKRKVLRSKVHPHPRAPTIDHIIPISKGGSHEPKNVATACSECNSRKQNRAIGDQLALVG